MNMFTEVTDERSHRRRSGPNTGVTVATAGTERAPHREPSMLGCAGFSIKHLKTSHLLNIQKLEEEMKINVKEKSGSDEQTELSRAEEEEDVISV